jgi:hypothetical protein
LDYEDEAAVLVETIIENTEDIYEYITNQIGGFYKKTFYTKKEEHNGKEITTKHFISVSSFVGLYKCEVCREKNSIIGWHMKYFETSFSCAVQSINQYFDLGLLRGLSKKEVKKIMKYAEKYHTSTFVEYE